jgi:ubiquinone/menaquinone biosynthesis C-methylase UbiE
MDGGLARGFRDVDANDGPDRFAAYLDTVSALLAEEKRMTIELMCLPQGGTALDVGCGNGDEVRLIAERLGLGGRAVGLDLSEALLVQARARSAQDSRITFVAADAHAMPFSDGEFDGVRVERALQHMRDPITALREMGRVVRSGGRVVAMEPDWPALVVSGEDLDTSRAVVQEFGQNVRNPTAGRSLPAWITAAGLVLDRLDPSILIIRRLDLAKRLVIGEALDRLDGPAVQAWEESLRQQDANGTFFVAVIAFVAVAVKP